MGTSCLPGSYLLFLSGHAVYTRSPNEYTGLRSYIPAKKLFMNDNASFVFRYFYEAKVSNVLFFPEELNSYGNKYVMEKYSKLILRQEKLTEHVKQ